MQSIIASVGARKASRSHVARVPEMVYDSIIRGVHALIYCAIGVCARAELAPTEKKTSVHYEMRHICWNSPEIGAQARDILRCYAAHHTNIHTRTPA